MPTTYRVCGSAIEKVGPASDQVRPIAFCADRNTAEILCESLLLLESIHMMGAQPYTMDTVALLKRAGLI